MAITNAHSYFKTGQDGIIPDRFRDHFIVDTNEQMEALDKTRLKLGSTCTVVQQGETYLIDSTGTWTKYYPQGSTPGPTPPEPEPEHAVIYDATDPFPFILTPGSGRLRLYQFDIPVPTQGHIIKLNFDNNLTNIIGNKMSSGTSYLSDIETNYHFDNPSFNPIRVMQAGGGSTYAATFPAGVVAETHSLNVTTPSLQLLTSYFGSKTEFVHTEDSTKGRMVTLIPQGMTNKQFSIELTNTSGQSYGVGDVTVENLVWTPGTDNIYDTGAQYHFYARIYDGTNHDEILADQDDIKNRRSRSVDISQYPNASRIGLWLSMDSTPDDETVFGFTQGITLDVLLDN